jgi:hypothetical protein
VNKSDFFFAKMKKTFYLKKEEIPEHKFLLRVEQSKKKTFGCWDLKQNCVSLIPRPRKKTANDF